MTEAGLKARWPDGVPEKIRAVVEKELALIKQLQYEHFFLTVHEIVQWARGRPKPILCQGRGSAANSVVCYALRITEVDPSNIAALFERFISEERNEPPDIDVDFEHERREEVIQHVFEKYGRERAALAATVITYRPKSAIRDVGKALGLDPDVIDRLAKSQAYWDNWEAFRDSIASQGLHLDADVMRRLCALVKELLNFPRHLSQHVGGFVIAEEPGQRPGADRERGDARAPSHSVGQERSGIARPAQGRRARARHAHGHAADVRSACDEPAPARRTWSRFRARIRRRTT